VPALLLGRRSVLTTLGLERRPRDVTPDATAQLVEAIKGGM